MCIKHILKKIPCIKHILQKSISNPIIELYECYDCNYITTNINNYNKHCNTHKECEITITRVRGRYSDLQEIIL